MESSDRSVKGYAASFEMLQSSPQTAELHATGSIRIHQPRLSPLSVALRVSEGRDWRYNAGRCGILRLDAIPCGSFRVRLAVEEALSREVERIERERIYQGKVFFMQSLGFITATDARKITPEDALRFERIHQRTYLAFDYQIIPIAAGPLPEPERIALSIRSSPSRFHLTPIESMSRLLDDPFLAEGIRLFNQGELFAAHEVWEKIWLAAEGDDRLFCQALIQVAVALLHAQRGNLRGAFSVYAKARHKLNRFPAVWAQIELGEFRSALAACFAALKAGRMLDQLPKIARKSLIA